MEHKSQQDVDTQHNAIPEQCSDCPIAKTLSGEALELLIKNCMGLKTIERGCETISVCDSPYRKDRVKTTTD